jgi:hypothetical protein
VWTQKWHQETPLQRLYIGSWHLHLLESLLHIRRVEAFITVSSC